MRYAIIVAAFGLVLGAPVLAPTSLMPAAVAQTAAETALQIELIAAAGDADALAAIIARENAAGNTDGLATALASASVTLAATDVAGAAVLVIQAVTVAEDSDSVEVLTAVGTAASTVATTALDNNDVDTAVAIEVKAVESSSTELALQYGSAGAMAGTSVQQIGGDDDQGGNQGGNNQGDDGGDDDDAAGGDDTTTPTSDTTTPTGDDTTPTTPDTPPPPSSALASIGLPIPPTSLTIPTIPVVIEPNPAQSGSPT
ncbi:MAG: hypothetical protein KUG56_02900 [Kordiimonadaceae bacterium]|nr:hypothetical protein [Kordiimonadaceae bacterium]